jgi:mono/diheme cytochrome c family protein
MTLLNKLVLANLITALLLSMSAQAFNIDNGKALHNENCVRCHDASMYTRKDRKTKSYELLRERVVQCEIMTELIWFEEEINDVTAYLNQTYFHFNPEK